MNQSSSQTPLTRRSLLARLATAAAVLGTSRFAQADSRPRWNKDFELAINLLINQPGGGRYHRPYVAVWVEDASGNAVRTLSLWVQTSGRGPRWIPDLKRWYRKELSRRKASGGDLIDVISGATRNPGNYSLVWNGRDDDGQLVSQGSYTVCIEAAREHGTYQLIREDLTIGTQPFSKDLGGNIEIKEASVAFRKR